MWDTIFKLLRALFFALDRIIFGLIGDVYGLLLQICRTSVFDTDAIHSFSSRIYVFIGLFMLFKLSVSLITYLLNPDDFTKGDKNFGKIVKNAILALVMVVLCPYVFTELFELQSIILEENTIMNVAFGTPNDASTQLDRFSNSSYADSAGDKIQFTLAYTFAQPNYQEFANYAAADLIDCRYTYEKDNDGNFTFRKKALTSHNTDPNAVSKFIYNLNSSCFGIYNQDTDRYEQEGSNGQLIRAFALAKADEAYQDYAQGVAQQSFSLFFKKEAIVDAKLPNGGGYVINYRFAVSTAVGVATLYLLLMFCIDLAVRSVKLGFLQMIAPIPILSYVDPKSGKDGMFNKWFKSVKNTYLDLFIRLFALYFGIYVITLVGRFRDVVTGEIVDNWIVRIFMILGVLIFVKKLPEFLKDALGFEGTGTFKNYLSPFKKIEEDALFGKNITGAVAGTAGGIIGAATGAGLLRGVTGGIGGALGGKGFKDTWKNTKDKNAKLRTANLVDTHPIRRTLGRIGMGVSDAVGVGGPLADIERREANINRRIGRIDEQIKSVEDRKNQIKGGPEYRARQQQLERQKAIADSLGKYKERAIQQVEAGQGDAGRHYNLLMQHASQARAEGRGQDAARLEQEASDYKNNLGWRDYATEVESGTTSDATLMGYSRKAQDAYRVVHGTDIARDGEAMNAAFGAAKGAITDLEIAGSADERQLSELDREIAQHNQEKAELNGDLRRVSDDKKRYESYRTNK